MGDFNLNMLQGSRRETQAKACETFHKCDTDKLVLVWTLLPGK